MKTLIILSLIFVTSFLAIGQEKNEVNILSDNKLLLWKQELNAASDSDYIDTFSTAFIDPNILIGVFERPKFVPNVLPSTTLSSGAILEELPGYWEAMTKYESIIKLRCIKPIKGKYIEPVVFVISPPTVLTLKENNIPTFAPFNQTKWILALRRTTPDYRADKLGEDVGRYTFLNDDTVFSLFHWGHGAFCLQWPQKELKPEKIIMASDDIIQELKAIEQTMSYMQKKTLTSTDLIVLDNTKNALKTPQAKAIFTKILQKRQNQE